ncbi:MAG: GMC family oxidoreductase N-terminal domain-containing protein [Solirubrobacteraceae bacterium]|nr:GMC family oxidoreductase N-terminal domain-containing protein [Solirubrobacteraceae bacterium]
MRDVIIIGCGGGGPVMAKELAAQGLDVLVLEGGARFADPENEWSRLDNDANNPTSGYFRVGPSDRSKPPYIRSLPRPSYVWQVAGVGGTTLHYYANNPRSQVGTFLGYDGPDKDLYDTAHLFPFSLEELRPYYEWVEETLPVRPAPIGTKENVFFRGAEGIGLKVNHSKEPRRFGYRAQQNAILQPGGTAGKVKDPQYPEAQGCTMCGHCSQGCSMPRRAPRNLKAKRSTDNSYVPMMLTADAWSPGGRPAELIADAYVQKVITEKRNGVPTAVGVRFQIQPEGEHYEERAKIIVMAGGAVETPRLWGNSDLPNPNGWVGRGLTDHHLDWVVGMFDEYTGTSRGQNSAARTDFPGYGAIENVGFPPGLNAFAQTYSDNGFSGSKRNGSPATLAGADSMGRLVGDDLRSMMSNVDGILNCLVIPDDDVEWQNRAVRQVPDLVDTNGPIARIDMMHRKRSARTYNNREFLAAKAVQLLRAAGAKRVHRMDWPPLILHSHSSMRMGLDPSNSICDEWSKARAVDNLYIADNSMLANGAGGSNPTLTTQAIVTRTAERIMTQHFGGEPWVKGNAPVSSTDSRISDAMDAIAA